MRTRSQKSRATPPHLQESLRRFRKVHPDPQRAAFIMMRFGSTPAHAKIVDGIRAALEPMGIMALRADEAEYHEDLLPNILTYVYGCRFGVAVFERIEQEEFNPNVSLEVGIMLALRKPVCFLKDQTLRTLQTDLVGKLYRPFDPQEPVATISPELERWVRDHGLSPGTGGQPEPAAVGTRVVIRDSDKFSQADKTDLPGWRADMDQYSGAETEITGYRSGYYTLKVDGGKHVWAGRWLTRIPAA
jgi:hypothetical protein